MCRRRDLWRSPGQCCTGGHIGVRTDLHVGDDGARIIDGYCIRALWSASVAVTRQRILSPGSTTDGDRVRVSVVAEEIFAGVPVPPVCGPLVGVPPRVCGRCSTGECCTGRHIGVWTTDLHVGDDGVGVIDGYCLCLGQSPVCVGGCDAAENVVSRVYDGRTR